MAENPDPGGGSREFSEDWKFITNNTRIVVLPDPRLNRIISEDLDDDQSSETSSHVQGEGLDELEYEYEPGIALQHLEFGTTAPPPTPRNSVIFANSPNPCLGDSVISTASASRCLQCGVDYESDLQLAAELGKTLLERNKELEGTLREHQSIIEDQSQEIEYLTKQTSSLREVNDSRVKIYEQLEVSISELEATNKKLIDENSVDKGKIKSLCENVEKLETRCEELQRLLEESRILLEKQQQLQRRRRERRKSSQQRFEVSTENVSCCQTSSDTEDSEDRTASSSSGAASGSGSSGIESTQESGYSSGSHLPSYLDSDSSEELSSEPISNLENERLKVDKMEIEERLTEMEKVVATLQAENRKLQTLLANGELANMSDSYRSVDDEVQDVHDVRRGKFCRKCLNLVDATPANLIGTAFQMMGDTANQELERVFADWQKDGFRLRSRKVWLDLWFLAVAFFALTLALTSSLANLIGQSCT